MTEPLETELKLRLEADTVRRVKAHPLLRSSSAGRPTRRRLRNIYFDTPDLALEAQHVAVRLRRVGGAWLQTVKSGGEARLGMHRRREWEVPVPRAALDPARLPDSDLSALLRTQALRPVFETDFWRVERPLRWKDGSRIEVALDQGEIRAGEASEPICELELELKEGHPSSLYEVALALAVDLPFAVEHVSKAERGYGMLHPRRPAPEKASPAGLDPAMSVEDAFATALASCLAQLQANERAVLVAHDREGVHQMRVALRRLRAVLQVFRMAIPREASQELIGDLKWLNGELGPARDWDVFATETVEPLLRHAERDRQALRLERLVAEAASKSWQHAVMALQGRRYAQLLLKAGHWLVGRGWQRSMSDVQRARLADKLSDYAGEALARGHYKLRKAGHHIQRLSPEERHRLRIRVKKQRYAATILGEIYPKRRTRQYVKALTCLQDLLGALNDGVVARCRLEELGLAKSPLWRLVQGWHACQAEHLLRDLPAAWKRFAECRPFWE